MRCLALLALLVPAFFAGLPTAAAGEVLGELAVSVVVVGACSASLAGDRLRQDCAGSPSVPGEAVTLHDLAAGRPAFADGMSVVRLDRAAESGLDMLTIVY